MKNKLFGQIPPGVKDYLPLEAKHKRVVEDKCLKYFESWGYEEVVTPTFEYYDCLKPGGDEQEELWYKFLDRKGHMLVLRPDMTTPIARMVSTRLKNEPMPLRLCYMTNIFSYEDPQAGRQREFYQAGVELIGSSQEEADAEVIALAIELMQAVGLNNFQVSLNQIGIFNGLMEELRLTENEQKRIKYTVSNKDFVGLENLIRSFNIAEKDMNRVIKMLTLRGGKETLVQARELTSSAKVLNAIDNLSQIYAILETQGLKDVIFLDFGLLRGLEYYTGLIFEGYAAGLGFSICGGGRYDRLLGQYGYDIPATGFALGIDRVLLALERNGGVAPPGVLDYLIVYPPQQREEALLEAKKLREEGYRVATELVERSLEDSISYARTKGAMKVLALSMDGKMEKIRP